MPKKDHYVIIGNGPAGNRAADVLREKDKLARVTIISEEAFSFYYRHKLPEFVAKDVDENRLVVRPYQDYKDKSIRVRLGQQVERIDPDNRILYLKHMEKIGYTQLILAVGGSPRVPPSVSRFQEHLVFLSTYTDAIKLRPQLKKAKKIIVFGGDLVSLSFIKELTDLNKQIIFFLCRETFWPFDLTSDMTGRICSNLKKKKIQTVVDEPVEAIARKGSEYVLKTESGQFFKSDMVVAFMGSEPNIRFIVGSGIDTERGVLVDSHLRTNYRNIYACGDCAQIYNPELKNYWVSIGWSNAELQGEIAVLNMLGDHKVIKPAPKKVFEFEGIKVNTSWWKDF